MVVACLFEQVLPASFAYIICAVIVTDVIAVLIIGSVTGRNNEYKSAGVGDDMIFPMLDRGHYPLANKAF